MRARMILFPGSMFSLCLTAAFLPSIAHALPNLPAHVTSGCQAVDTYQVSAAQSAAAMSYWTPQQTAAAAGFSATSIAGILRSMPRQTQMPGWTKECLPVAAPTSAGAVSQASEATLPRGIPDTTSINGYPTVGKFFFKIHSVGNLNCTATAINDAKGNPKRELILTAAHCLEGALDGEGYTTNDWLYAPMWHDNKFPFGKWAVQSVWIDPGWMMCAFMVGCQTNPKYDYAVLVLKQQHGHGVGYYTGQAGWNIKEPKIINVRIIGIPGSSSKAKVNVTRSVTVTIQGIPIVGRYLARKANTPGFTDGSSGGPWFFKFNTSNGLGLLTGDTGGFEGGGPATGTPSYSSYWDTHFANLVALAARHE